MTVHTHDVPTWEVLRLVEPARIGRMCIVDHGTPIALPVNFHLLTRDQRHQVVVRTGPNSLIGRYTGPASLEVDEIDIDHLSAWSVILRGTVAPVGNDRTLPDPEPWLEGRDRWMVMQSTR